MQVPQVPPVALDIFHVTANFQSHSLRQPHWGILQRHHALEASPGESPVCPTWATPMVPKTTSC